MEQFITSIESQQPITEFDEETWTSLVDFVTVYSEKDIRVTFRDSTEGRSGWSRSFAALWTAMRLG